MVCHVKRPSPPLPPSRAWKTSEACIALACEISRHTSPFWTRLPRPSKCQVSTFSVRRSEVKRIREEMKQTTRHGQKNTKRNETKNIKQNSKLALRWRLVLRFVLEKRNETTRYDMKRNSKKRNKTEAKRNETNHSKQARRLVTLHQRLMQCFLHKEVTKQNERNETYLNVTKRNCTK